jgi:hypothetical protein
MLSDELTIQFGMLPRANRGIFALNELPDLSGKVQVGLFNIMQEGDVQIKGFPVRLPLDVMLCFTANPEDYTARGKIITPLKDRIGSEIVTHYPLTVDLGVSITKQEAWTARDSVKIVVDARQENGRSSQIYLDLRMTPSVEALQRLIKHAKTRGLKVILMPIVLLDRPTATEWRGTLAPENWGEWFKSYRSMMGHFAWIAESSDVDMLVVGSELVSSETKVEEWRKTIAHVRKIYKGKLTYSSNWDKYETVAFWDDLDVIGMNSYWKLDGGKKSKAQVDDIVEAWQPILRDVTEFASEQGKPVFFLEVGWCSIANAAHEPWDYTADREPIDNDLQKRLYEGFFRTWWGNEHLAGFSVWEWTPGDGGKDEQTVNRRGYTPENKPAEAVLRQWLAKDRWVVR